MTKEHKDSLKSGGLAEKNKGENGSKSAHKRIRTKRIVALLKDQIEFYFSDSNLLKDRFMKQAILNDPDGYVEIKTIASFNRMKQLTEDVQLIVKAMKMSAWLQVSEDEAKVKRIAPLPEPKNVDLETIYVEKLPPYADHDWLKQVFSPCGNILYVSIPRFKQTGEAKGFAFIEFETEDQAKSAVQMFDKGGAAKKQIDSATEANSTASSEKSLKGKRKRSHSESDADSYRQTHKSAQKRKKTTSESSVESVESNGRKSGAQDVGEGQDREGEQAGEAECRKRKKTVHWEEGGKCQRERGDEAVKESKKKRLETVEESAQEERGEKRHGRDTGDSSTGGRKRSSGEGAGGEESPDQAKRPRATDSESDEGERTKKKSKKRKRKKKEKREARLPHLRVISKLQWLNFKQQYKTLQRQAMQGLKQQLKEARPSEPTEPTAPDSAANTPDHQPNRTETAVPLKPEPAAFVAGVLLRFDNPDSALTRKEVREKFASHGPVAYVDMEQGAAEGFVRFHSAEICKSVLEKFQETPPAGLRVQQLQGEEEKQYWRKINEDREARYKAKRQKKRGADKVTSKADSIQAKRHSHIRFDRADQEPGN